jgi:hypothetical protein
MPRRKIGDEDEARRCLSAIDAEGGDLSEWARAHGVDGRSLHAWRMNFARWGEKTPAPVRRRRRPAPNAATRSLVELVPTAPVLSSSTPGRYVLEVGNMRVEFADGFSEPTLRRVIEILRSC